MNIFRVVFKLDTFQSFKTESKADVASNIASAMVSLEASHDDKF